MPQFVHLHLHSDSSLLDGLSTVEQYVAKAKQNGQTALALSDHGNLSGIPSFYRECRANDIAPLLFEEFYFVPDNARYVEMKGERFHVGIGARGERGYAVLSELSTEAHRNFHYKPCIDRHILKALSKKDRESLVVLSGCAGSIISRKLLGTEPGEAKKEIQWWAKMFPHFYIELMHHDTSFDKKLNGLLWDAAKKMGLPWVITQDSHYAHKDDSHAHSALLAIQTASDIDDPNRFRFEGEGYWLKSGKEIKKTFKSYDKELVKPGMKATLEVAELCHVRIPSWETSYWHIPAYPGKKDSFKKLEKLAWKGYKKRGLHGKKYQKRLEHELAAFKAIETPTGATMADFLLITRAMIQWAKKQGIRVGPGRGSVGGSLVAYCIELHNCDPLRYGLLFERFLNPERPKMPDIDTDYSKARRQEVLDHYAEVYGEENTASVAAFQTMQPRRAFHSMAKAYGIDFQERLRLSKTITEDEDGDVVWPEKIVRDYPDMLALINKLVGKKSAISSHPAGVVIFDPEDPIRELVPKMWIPKRGTVPGRFVMQYNLEAVDSLMLLKQDSLGLRTLDTIDECVKLVQDRHKVELDPDNWVPDEEERDDEIYAMLATGNTAGIFQLEGYANQRGIQATGCDSFNSIVVCTSLFRAGPIIAGADREFLRNKKDKKVRVLHESLRPYLEETWGTMIYQEQMFAILNEVAGLSWSRVDDVKTALTKKNQEKMASCQVDTIQGLIANDIKESVAKAIWHMMASQASYIFNKSHAVEYSMLSYQTARLKLLYPLEFYAALMRTVEPKAQSDKDKREGYLQEAVAAGYKIMPPAINVSDDRFMPHGDDELLFGLMDIKGLGDAAMNKLANWKRENGSFTSTLDVIRALKTKDQSKGIYASLAACGALREFGVEADEKKQAELLSFQFTDHMVAHRPKFEGKLVRPKGNNSKCVLYGELAKSEKRKTKKGTVFYVWTLRWAPGENFLVNVWEDAEDLFKIPKGTILKVSGKYQTAYNNVAVSDPSQVKTIKEA